MDRAVVKKRKAFEYKLRRKVKEKADFLNYIQVGLMNTVCTVNFKQIYCGSKYNHTYATY